MKKLSMLLSLFLCTVVLAEDAPKDATVLFDGKDLSKWAYKKDGSEAKWPLVADGVRGIFALSPPTHCLALMW